MKIIHYIRQYYPFIGGGEVFLSELSKYMENVEDVKSNTIITTRLPNTPQTEQYNKKTFIRRIGSETNYNAVFPKSKIHLALNSTIRDLSLYHALEEEVTNNSVIDIHGPMRFPLLFRYFPFKDELNKYTKHFRPWLRFDCPKVMHYHASYPSVADFDYDTCDVVIYTDRDLAEDFSERKNLRLIENGVDLKQFYPDPEHTKGTTILYLGRIIEMKGWEVMANAIKIAEKKQPVSYKTLFVGSGPEEKKLTKYSLDRIPGVPPERAREYYLEAEIVVCPLLIKGVSRVAMEAMACGRIILKSDISPYPIEDGKNGFLFKNNDPEDLADKILKILSLSENEKDKIRLNARKTAEEKFDIDDKNKETLEVYRSVVTD